MMRSILLLALTVTFAAACGGDPTPQPSTPQGTAPSAATPAKPAEPSRRAPRPAAADLYGAPSPTDDQLSELYDIGRNLEDLAKGASDAPGNLTEDLARFGPEKMPQTELRTLADDLARSLKGKTMQAEVRDKLAALLYAVMNSDEMDAAQKTSLAAALRTTLTSAGVAAKDAATVASRVDRVAAAATAAANR